MRLNLSDEHIKRLDAVLNDVCEVSDSGQAFTHVDYMHDQGLNAIWYLVAQLFQRFETRTSAFFYVLKKLIVEGRVKLHQGGVINDSLAVDELTALQQAWPLTSYEADKIVFIPGSPEIGTGAGMDLWFFMEACPVGIAWRQSDGSFRTAE
jgi:hypothetical protein